MPHRTATEEEGLLSPKTVSRLLEVSRRTVMRLVAAGIFPAPRRYSRKLVRWPSAVVRAWLANQQGGGAAALAQS